MTPARPPGSRRRSRSKPTSPKPARLAGHGLGVAILLGVFAVARSELLRSIAVEPALCGRLVFAWRAGGPNGAAGGALVSRAGSALRVAADQQVGAGE